MPGVFLHRHEKGERKQTQEKKKKKKKKRNKGTQERTRHISERTCTFSRREGTKVHSGYLAGPARWTGQSGVHPTGAKRESARLLGGVHAAAKGDAKKKKRNKKRK